jgi:murein DD-endopeptidase MepM/ murein hydrolase activator NlpD
MVIKIKKIGVGVLSGLSLAITSGLALGLVLSLFIGGCVTKRPLPAAVEALSAETVADEESPSQMEEMTAASIEKSTSRERHAFDWPVTEARLTRGFLPKKRGRPHLGIDLAASKGTAILSAHEGTVIYAGRDFRGYGNMVMIEGAEGFATLYAHFSRISVTEGEKVHQGDKIGEMGRTGRATGTHLHFEVRTNEGPVNPLNYLPNGAVIARMVEARKKVSR